MDFKTVKGNCDYHMADCEDDGCCPRWQGFQYKAELKTAFGSDANIAENPSAWIGGFILGMVGAASCLIILFLLNVIQVVPK